MSKLPDCQFIEIKIDNKVLAGSSEVSKYKEWMEGYASQWLVSYSGVDGAFFSDIHLSILVTKGNYSIFEEYLKRGSKEITITVVHRGSDEHEGDYEIQRTIYQKCNIKNFSFDIKSHKQSGNGVMLFMDLFFSFSDTIEVTFNVPNADASGLEKIGPIKYSIPLKDIV